MNIAFMSLAIATFYVTAIWLILSYLIATLSEQSVLAGSAEHPAKPSGVTLAEVIRNNTNIGDELEVTDKLSPHKAPRHEVLYLSAQGQTDKTALTGMSLRRCVTTAYKARQGSDRGRRIRVHQSFGF